ncbi:MAG: hypothetical protein HC842_08075 [Cytophagales bacterium]|nr:hypothetical protein [Cytophagales bacterium]
MTITQALHNAHFKSKQRAKIISDALVGDHASLAEFIYLYPGLNSKDKGTLLEGLEYATRLQTQLMSFDAFQLVVGCLSEKAPRIKWEAAKIVRNTAHLFPKHLDQAINHLLDNATHTGAVVRWSAAYALIEIAALLEPIQNDLLEVFIQIVEREEKSSIKSMYLKALSRVK